MEGPNVLFLDEPTNDFDVETLASLEDLLDGFAGTIIVVSHDRYFLERVCDVTLGFVGDGILRDLPRGLDQYFELRSGGGLEKSEKKNSSPALATIKIDQRELKKSIEKTERGLARRDEELKKLEVEMGSAEVSTDFTRLAQIHEEIERLRREKEALEQEWLALMEGLEGK
jgi:ATP-binding cassette subfamily F protein uup